MVNAKPDFDQIVEVKTTELLLKYFFDKKIAEVLFFELKNEPLAIGGTGKIGVKVHKGYNDLVILEVIDVIYTEFNDLSF